MKRALLTLFGVLVAVAFAAVATELVAPRHAGPPIAGAVEDFTPTDTPPPAPEVAFSDLAGTPHTLADFAGKVLVVNFWATWCAPCKAEMPALDRLAAALQVDNVSVLLVSLDREGAARVAPYLDELGLSKLTSYVDPRMALFSGFGGRGLPTTILLDRRGRELGRLEGPAEWDSPDAQALIRFYLEH